ncbi:MAG: YfiR family protein [Terracidiphilus sp.]
MKSRSAAEWPSVEARTTGRGAGRTLLACIMLLFLATSGASGADAVAQASRPNEYQVQAAYLYNFGKFVKWPPVALANQSGAFTICVLGQDPFGSVLESTLAGQTLGGKPVAIKRLAKAQDAAECHILSLSAAQRDLKETLAAIDDSSVLTVSDMPDFSKRGGMIQFILDGDRVRFEINLESAERSHLVFPSELLKVAAAVRRPGGPGE